MIQEQAVLALATALVRRFPLPPAAGDAPVAAVPGQAFFMKKGTKHGFRNTGTTPAAVFEIFVKRSTTSASVIDERDVAGWLSALSIPSTR